MKGRIGAGPRCPRCEVGTVTDLRQVDFPEPLRASEANAIAKSIATWITTHSRLWADGPTVYEATFTTIQAARGRKSGSKRLENARKAWNTND